MKLKARSKLGLWNFMMNFAVLNSYLIMTIQNISAQIIHCTRDLSSIVCPSAKYNFLNISNCTLSLMPLPHTIKYTS